MKTSALTLAAFLVLSCSARAQDKASKLLGKWEMVKGEIPAGSTAVFTKDGKVKVAIKREGKTEAHEGIYKLKGDTLTVTAKHDGEERTHTFKVKKLTDKELVLEDKGKETVFKKVK